MPKMSFAQPTDGWATLTNHSAEAASEHPGLAAVCTELAEALAEAKRSRNAHRRLRSRTLGEAKQLRAAIVRGEEAEKRLRRFLQAVYGAGQPGALALRAQAAKGPQAGEPEKLAPPQKLAPPRAHRRRSRGNLWE
jgi:hypothetical protein